MPKVIIVGATSGIGRELALKYAAEGYDVGITGRRKELLATLHDVYPDRFFGETMDIRDTDVSIQVLNKLFTRMGNVDLVVLNAGVGNINRALDWEIERQTILTNVYGISALLNAAMQYFLARGKGKIACVSSVAGIRGLGGAPAYSASKAFLMRYVEALQAQAYQSGTEIAVVDIRPGFVDTKMGQRSAFWRVSPEKAANQIYNDLKTKKDLIYVSSRWRLIGWLLIVMPAWIVRRIR